MDKSKPQVPTVGRIVHVILNRGTRPAIVTGVNGHQISATIFMQPGDGAFGFVANQERNTFPAEGLKYSEEQELITWRWPPKMGTKS